MKPFIPFVFACTVFILTDCRNQHSSSHITTNEKIDQLISSYHSLNRFNGTILVAKDGKILLSKGYGFADMEWEIPNSPSSVFQIASISKVFTATIIAKLVDQGKLTLDTKLSYVLPWYRKDNGNKISVSQLLNHTSGIPNYLTQRPLREMVKEFSTDPVNKVEFAKKYCSSDLEFEPGAEWKYNNSAYFLLGLIIEEITGQSYNDVVKEMIFEPLQMISSGDIQPNPDAIIAKHVKGYIKNFGGYVNAPYWNLSTTYAAGSLYSTSEDLLKFDRAFYTDTFVSAKSKAAMFTPGLNGYGCGWELRDIPIGKDSSLKKIQTHEGFLWAWHTRLYRIPEDGFCIVLLSNGGNAPLEQMFTGITDILYNRQVVYPKQLVSEMISSEYRKNGMDSAIALIHKLILLKKDTLETNENDLNRLGYQILNQGLPNESLKVFKLNTELYPNAWNVWDSYGEALAASGKNKEATTAYERSVQLNPASVTGINALKKLSAY